MTTKKPKKDTTTREADDEPKPKLRAVPDDGREGEGDDDAGDDAGEDAGDDQAGRMTLGEWLEGLDTAQRCQFFATRAAALALSGDMGGMFNALGRVVREARAEYAETCAVSNADPRAGLADFDAKIAGLRELRDRSQTLTEQARAARAGAAGGRMTEGGVIVPG